MKRILWTALPLLLAACQSGPRFHAAPGAIGPYSAAVEVGGFLFLSGQIGSERSGSFEDEAASAIDRVEGLLAEHGRTLADVYQVQVFLADIGDYGRFNEIYGARFQKPYPVRTCVAVKDLPADARVEIQASPR